MTTESTTPKRGRPTTGQAKSAAKRKQAQRERDETLIWEKSVPELPDRALLLILGNQKFEALQRYAWEELGRRKGFMGRQ